MYIPPVTTDRVLYLASMGDLSKLFELKQKYPVDFKRAYDKALQRINVRRIALDYEEQMLHDIALTGINK